MIWVMMVKIARMAMMMMDDGGLLPHLGQQVCHQGGAQGQEQAVAGHPAPTLANKDQVFVQLASDQRGDPLLVLGA